MTDQWNNLPMHVVMANSINSFKSRLDKFWHGSEVYFDHNTNIHQVTSARSSRRTPQDAVVNDDLMSEA